MGTKKDIGQAFKERLTDFNDSPNNLVWENIESELKNNKKDKKAFYFWLKTGSAALVLLILLFLNRDLFSGTNTSSTVKTKTTKVSNDSNTDTKDHSSFSKIDSLNSDSSNLKNAANQKIVVDQTPSNSHGQQNNADNFNNIINDSKTQKKSELQNSQNTKNALNINSSDNAIVKNENFLENLKRIETHSKKSNDKNHTENNNVENIQESIKEKQKSQLNYSQTSNDSVSEAITDLKLDDIVRVKKENKSEKLNKDQDSLQKTKASTWSGHPFTSFILYNGFGQSFSDKTSQNYGVYLNYLGAQKTVIRIGVNSLKLNHTYSDNTNETILQVVNYIEIPLEIKYALTEKKIQTSVIAGLSYLFLKDATIATSPDNFNIIETNKDDFTKSTLSINFGLGLQTKLYKSFYFNLESIFKYQFKPYSSKSTFDPYTVSISGGIEYKF